MAFPIPHKTATKVYLPECGIEVTVLPSKGIHATESIQMAIETKKGQQICQLFLAGVRYTDPADGQEKNMLLDELENMPAADMYLLIGATYGPGSGNVSSPEK